MTADSSFSRIYVNLTPIELSRLSKYLSENPDEPVNWWEIITPSADPDKRRADAIDRSRIQSAMRYHAKGGPRRGYGSNSKRQENIMSRTEIRRRGL